MFKRLITVTAVALVACMAIAGAAFALGVTGTIAGTAGIVLDPGSAPTFSDTLSGSDQTVTYQPGLSVTDARGTGAGWHLTVSATSLTDGTHTPLAQSVSTVAQACASGSTCSLPTNSVTDARGTGAGWHLTVSATSLTDGTHTPLAQSVSTVAQACASGSTCSLPTNSVTLPVAVGSSGTSFYSAASAAGLGKVNVTPTVSVAIPGNAYAGSYNSTVTFAAVAGP